MICSRYICKHTKDMVPFFLPTEWKNKYKIQFDINFTKYLCLTEYSEGFHQAIDSLFRIHNLLPIRFQVQHYVTLYLEIKVHWLYLHSFIASISSLNLQSNSTSFVHPIFYKCYPSKYEIHLLYNYHLNCFHKDTKYCLGISTSGDLITLQG